MQKNAVVIESLTFKYASAQEPALKDIDLTFRQGEIALLIGPTGAGKSTLYMCLNGLIPHLIQGRMFGKVTIAGMDTTQHNIAHLAQQVGIVFQDPEIQLFSLTVQDELAFGPENLGLSKEEILTRVDDAVTIIGLRDLLEREPARLSGGQQQTVAIGSVWSMLPDVLIMDEPTSNLDPEGSRRVLDLIKKLNNEYGKTILIAEHKIDEVAHLADHVFVMYQGQIVADGTPHDVFGKPEMLHELGLVAPVAAELAYRLQCEGKEVGERLPLTIEDGIKVFGRLLAGG
jgi:energy-coupling factor transport system ATP-binding protein